MSLSIESRRIHLEGDDPDPERRLSGGAFDQERQGRDHG